MNKELEATLVHVLRMPDHWQKQAAKAMLPTVYKWQTRISLPHLTDEEFDQQWRAAHRPGLLQRIAHVVSGSKAESSRPAFVQTGKNWSAAVARGFRSLTQAMSARMAGRKESSRELAGQRHPVAMKRLGKPRSIQPETRSKSAA
jgi:hypothetical protein